MAKKKQSKKKKTSLFFTSVVIIALLVMVVVFLIKKDTILSNFKDTGFFDKVFGSTPEFVQNHDSSDLTDAPLPEEGVVINLINDEVPALQAPVVSEPVKPVSESKSEEKPSSSPAVTETKPAEASKPVTQEKPAETSKPAAEPVQTSPKPVTATTDLQLCFVYISPEGSVMRKIVKRTVPKNDSPLTTAINLLLKGPDTTLSAEKDLSSLIPAGTKLLSAKVQDGVAYLSFSSDFERNSIGSEGYNAQLMQIVFTATSFSTVNSVQFLIEGEKLDYLPEAVWIGSPLSRSAVIH